DRFFEAFYSTKSHGMGIGLSICRSIIEAHEGRIWATANLPRGATLHITLPAAVVGKPPLHAQDVLELDLLMQIDPVGRSAATVFGDRAVVSAGGNFFVLLPQANPRALRA